MHFHNEVTRIRKGRIYLYPAMPATSPRNHKHVLVYWERCLQGLEIPATEPARADSDNRDCPAAGHNNRNAGITVVPQNPKQDLVC